MTANELSPIEQILRDRIGLDPAALGPRGVEAAVAARMRRCGITALPSYTSLLSTSPDELEALIEAVVIPETWFFRDREPFVFLADFIRSEWKAKHADEVLRILSVPCATGEEPYSIAMTCRDCGLAPNQFSIAARDINAAFLRKAREAVYGRNSFRGTAPWVRERFFTIQGNSYALKAEIRECVRFSRINILEPGSLPGAGHYTIVFCRNLLIYLHDQARTKALAAIDSILAAGGLLFIGHAEANPLLADKYEAIKHPGAFAYRKKAEKQFEVLLATSSLSENGGPAACYSAKSAEAAFATKHEPRAGISAGRTSVATERDGHPASAPSLSQHAATAFKTPARQTAIKSAHGAIEQATRLANAGRLDEAGEECAAIINADRQNAAAHFLMGLIKAARGDNAGAAECFNHAIYLDTNFSDAILHLAILKEESGDTAGAETLRRRAGAIIHGA